MPRAFLHRSYQMNRIYLHELAPYINIVPSATSLALPGCPVTTLCLGASSHAALLGMGDQTSLDAIAYAKLLKCRTEGYPFHSPQAEGVIGDCGIIRDGQFVVVSIIPPENVKLD